jgi:hypothetical protein
MENKEAGHRKYRWKNILVGRNPDTGRAYFDRKKTPVVDLNEPPEMPPDEGLLTKEEYEAKVAAGEIKVNKTPEEVDPEKMEEEWKNATSKEGRPPIGGAQDD